MIVRLSPPVPASDVVTIVTHLRMTTYTTTLKIVGGRELPCVTPQYPLNGRQNYPLALANMVSWSHYVQIIRTVLGQTLYAARRSKSFSRSKAS